jgi:receptor-type tyrosine-protein phosphatase N
VDFKANDDRYFVLTFVLCGCIAGILLAVVVIYLIRRNSRSKEKLQQITAGQDGNEAASKDYQVSKRTTSKRPIVKRLLGKEKDCG